jgi:SAM-dependent methyltransferase
MPIAPRSCRSTYRRAVVALLGAALLAPAAVAQDNEQPIKKDVPYVPTPQELVEKMIEVAKVTEKDTVYDLGCGDGRMVVTAAKKHGARGIGVDIDPERIKEANANAKEAGVTDKVKFIQADLFTMDFKEADVLLMYLLPSVNVKLRPKILELKPGTRIVSHAFDMGDWEADDTIEVDGRTAYFWLVPAKVDGQWQATLKDGGQQKQATLNLKQEYQQVSGTAEIDGKKVEIKDAKLKGDQLTLALDGNKTYTVRVDGANMQEVAKGQGANGDAQTASFTAKRQGGAQDQKQGQQQEQRQRAPAGAGSN